MFIESRFCIIKFLSAPPPPKKMDPDVAVEGKGRKFRDQGAKIAQNIEHILEFAKWLGTTISPAPKLQSDIADEG